MGTVLKQYNNNNSNNSNNSGQKEEDLKRLTVLDLNHLLEKENNLYNSIGSNLHDKGEKLLKHIDLINSIIIEKKQYTDNNNNNNINSNSNNNNISDISFKNMEKNIINSISGLNLDTNGKNQQNQHSNKRHQIKQLSVEESSQILQSNILESKISSLDKKFNDSFDVNSPISKRRRNIGSGSGSGSVSGGEEDDDELLDEEIGSENEQHDYVNPDELDDEVDLIDPFEDKPYDQGFNYKLNDEFHYFDDDT